VQRFNCQGGQGGTYRGAARFEVGVGRSLLRHPGSRPYPHLPAGTDTLPDIEHIVVLMMENHSYDNFFGMLGRGDGFTLGPDGLPTAANPYPNGQIQHSFHMPSAAAAGDSAGRHPAAGPARRAGL